MIKEAEQPNKTLANLDYKEANDEKANYEVAEVGEYSPDPNEPKFGFKYFYIQYARFHSDRTNILIHLIFVPIISFSVVALLELQNFSILIKPDQALHG